MIVPSFGFGGELLQDSRPSQDEGRCEPPSWVDKSRSPVRGSRRLNLGNRYGYRPHQFSKSRNVKSVVSESLRSPRFLCQ